MERYKKRTIALCLASLLTVVGAFGAENYNNSLMELKINNSTEGYINITAYTEKPFTDIIKTNRTDKNTYEITLENTNSNVQIPDISRYRNVKSIEIATAPYTTNRIGYTKITVKTIGSPTLKTSPALYVPGKPENKPAAIPKQKKQDSYWNSLEKTPVNTGNKKNNDSYKKYSSEKKDYTKQRSSEEYNNVPQQNATDSVQKTFVPPDYKKNQNSGNSFEHMAVVLCALVLFLIIGIIFMLSKDKMNSVVGEHKDFDLDSNDKTEKNKKNDKPTIKRTINKLDQEYPNNSFSAAPPAEEPAFNEDNEPENVVVDLDTLYQEKTQQSLNFDTIKQEENNNNDDDLADFLSEFTFEEDAPEELFDEELFNEIINNQNLSFSQADTVKINQLIQVEIDENLIAELREKTKENTVYIPTQKQKLEEFVSAYSTNPNISFSNDDIKTLTKLMNIEISKDFTIDLRTNPNRTKVVEKEIRESKPVRKSEILTLSVKDLLPDLSKELKKQGNKKIESEVKPQVVYFSEGYEYTKLTVSDDLSDIAKSLKNKNENTFQPSYEAPIVETGYEVSTLTIKDELPDLNDVKANPQKYEDKPKEKLQIDENALLKSLSNVTFKPFYDEVQEELNQFDNFEIIDHDSSIINEVFEPDNIIEEQQNTVTESNNFFKEQQNTIVPAKTKPSKIDDDAKKLLKLIEEKQAERELKKMATEDTKLFKKELESATIPQKQPPKAIKYNGEEGEIIQSVQCAADIKFMLVKHLEGYSVVGRTKNRAIEIKKYDSLKNPNIQARLNDKNNKEQYLIKVSNHKIVVKVADNNMEFVMDLC